MCLEKVIGWFKKKKHPLLEKYRLLHTRMGDTPCNACKAFTFEISENHITQYFNGQNLICGKCGEQQDLWELIIRHFDWHVPEYIYSIVGGYHTTFLIDMQRNSVFDLDLTEVAIPSDAKILQIGYTPNGKGLFPIEMHGNVPPRHFIPNKLRLFGYPFGEATESTPVAVSINWLPKERLITHWSNLVEAVEAFTNRNFAAMIIPANVAVESKLSHLLKVKLSKYVSNDRVERFLSDGATYSHQLNVLLPILSHYEKLPVLPDFIRGNLNSLRSLRNELAHDGKLKVEMESQRAGELICSAFFSLAYLQMIVHKIL